MERLLPEVKSFSCETENEINTSISRENEKQKLSVREANSALDSLYTKYQDEIPLDPMFKDHIENLMEQTQYWTQKLRLLKQNQAPGYETIHTLFTMHSDIIQSCPKQFEQLSEELTNLESETKHIYEEEIPKLIEEYDNIIQEQIDKDNSN